MTMKNKTPWYIKFEGCEAKDGNIYANYKFRSAYYPLVYLKAFIMVIWQTVTGK